MRSSLSELPFGSRAVIVGFVTDRSNVDQTWPERLMDLGFLPGARVESLFRAPLGGASVYRVHNTAVALRDEEALCIMVSNPVRSDSQD